MKQKLALIGNGMAGVRTLEGLFKHNTTDAKNGNNRGSDLYDITVIGAEPHPNYNRIMLSPVLAGEQTIDDSILNSLEWYEENHKRLKQWVEIENFSGKSALSVQQDFYAKIVASNLTALMAMAAQKTITKKTKHLKLKYQINFAQALSKMKHRVACLILHAHSDIKSLIERTIRYVSKTIEAAREERSTPRRLKNIKNDIHFPAYKSSL